MKRQRDETSRLVNERDFLGALLVAIEHGPVRSASLGGLSVGDFVSPHAAATFQELSRAVDTGRSLKREELVATLVRDHGAAESDARAYVDGLVADAPALPHLGERARRVRESTLSASDTPTDEPATS